MKDLSPRRVTDPYTPEEMTEIESLIALLKSKIKSPFPMTNTDFDIMSKIAEVKYKEISDKYKILKDNNGFISDKSAVPYIGTSLQIFGQSTRISELLAEVENKVWRNGDIAGHQAMNQMAFCDRETRLKATEPIPEAVDVVNQWDDLKVVRKAAEPKQPPKDKPDGKK